MQSLRIICPNGHLGFAPTREESFRLGVADNVVVSSAVPEPASMGLLLVGGLLTLRRRRSSI